MIWTAVIFVIIIQIYPQLVKPQTFGKGKYLTMPLRRKWPKVFDHIFCRFMQTIMCLGVFLMINPFWHGIFWIYIIALAAFSIDDYFTDEDNWKKFKEWAKNKIKWKMVLPKPATGKVAS